MKSKIVKVTNENYPLFDDMIYWRLHDSERKPNDQVGIYGSGETKDKVSDEIKRALNSDHFQVYAVKSEDKFVGWISLIYMPKIGRYQGKGFLYVDELWVQPTYRNKGLAKKLMEKANEVAKTMEAIGLRLYVNAENPGAKELYKKCGYEVTCDAIFMEKR